MPRPVPVSISSLLLAVILAAVPLIAQSPTVPTVVKVEPSHPQLIYFVDGKLYTGERSFSWPEKTKHTLEVREFEQTIGDGRSRLVFSSWSAPDNGLNWAGSVITITADTNLLRLVLTASYEHRLDLAFHRTVIMNDGNLGGTWPGWLFVGGGCQISDASLWYADQSEVQIMASPNPGYVFAGWDYNQVGNPNVFGRSIKLTQPAVVTPVFTRSVRMTFRTDPEGMQVLVNRALVPTKYPGEGCPEEEAPYIGRAQYPPPVDPLPLRTGVETGCPGFPLCTGTLDFLPGSKLVLGQPPNQNAPADGHRYVFDRWIAGGQTVTEYTVPERAGTTGELTAKFVRAVWAAIQTSPIGLNVNVDERPSWPMTTFEWALGSKHKLSAPLEQTDSNGRRYRFAGWSDGVASAEREVEMGNATLTEGLKLTANYQILGQLSLRSEPSGMSIQAGDTTCKTPCTINLPAGTQLGLAPVSPFPLSPDTRLDFNSWADGGAALRTYQFSADAQTLLARFSTKQRLTLRSDPPEGADFVVEPPTTDGFYAQGERVTIAAQARPGYKFRRWDGSISGLTPSGTVVMSSPASIVARMDEVPVVTPTSVRNAAGETPERVVAPGSLIEITGKNLARTALQGPASPLVQSLGGVTVDLGGRYLPLVSVSPDVIRAQLPFDLAPGDHVLTVRVPSQETVDAKFTAVRNAPGLFRQEDQNPPVAFATRENGTLVSTSNPARNGETVTLYGTGFGPFSRAWFEGFAFPLSPPLPLADPLQLTAGGQSWPVAFSGAAPGHVGFSVVRFRIAPEMPRGNVEFSVQSGGRTSNPVIIPIQ